MTIRRKEKNLKLLEKIYNDYSNVVLGICRRYLKNEQVAEDIMQETFILIYNKMEQYKGKGSFKNWIMKITINNCLMYLRTKNKIKYITLDNELGNKFIEQQPEDENLTPNLISNYDFSVDEILDSIDHLNDSHKLVFNLFAIDGYSHKNIASMLNIPINTSKSYLLRARVSLRKILNKKAIEKQEYNKRKKWAFILPLMFKPGNYIDWLAKCKLKKLKITPATKYNAISIRINNQLSIYKPVSFFKLQYLNYLKLIFSILIISGISLIGIYYMLTFKKSKELNEQPIENIINKDSINISEEIVLPQVKVIENKTDKKNNIKPKFIDTASITKELYQDSTTKNDSLIIENKKVIYMNKNIIISDTVQVIVQ